MNMGPQTYVFRSEMGYREVEKRQLFLRSYTFSRKQSVADKIKTSFFRVKKAISVRFRTARRLRKTIWFKLKNGLFFSTRRKRFFLRLHAYNYYYNTSRQSSCF